MDYEDRDKEPKRGYPIALVPFEDIEGYVGKFPTKLFESAHERYFRIFDAPGEFVESNHKDRQFFWFDKNYLEHLSHA